MRTLLAQIYEPGQFHENAITQKRGLFNALEARGSCLDFDYMANDKATLFDGFVNRIDYHNPDVVFTQFHGADDYVIDGVRMLRQRYPGIRFVNWSGDSWSWSLTSDRILELAKLYDLWLVAAPDVLPVYEANGINGRYFQIAYEEPVIQLPDVPEYDVVFLGNIISEKRRELRKFLRTLPYRVGIYGDGDETDGHCTYDFAMQRALYQKAKIAIADAAHPDQRNYISDRPLTIMASGGAILLHQRIEKMFDMLGVSEGVHYYGWHDLDELTAQIGWIMQRADTYWQTRKFPNITKNAQSFVREHHTWECRVQQLVDMLGGM